MDRKDELDTFIKELSAKQQQYIQKQEIQIPNNDIDLPDLIPVDFDLKKNINPHVNTKEEAKEEMVIIKESFFKSILSKIKKVSYTSQMSTLKEVFKNTIKKKPGVSVLVIGLFVTLLGFVLFASGCTVFALSDSKSTEKVLANLNKADGSQLIGSDRVNILLLGIDSPDGKFNTRSDTIILISLDPISKKISALSIPRDTYVDIEGHGKNKINAANELGGPELTVKTVSKLLNVQIDDYAITNFNGFKGIVDTLGGVDLDVEKDMKYRTYNGWIDLKKGYQHLNGDKALQYVRFRHDSLGDISRTQRQQKFILALSKQAFKSETFLKLPKLIPQVSAVIKTDLGISEMVSLATVAKNLDFQNLNTQTLPGNFINIKGISYWYVDESKAKSIIENVFIGQTSEVVDTNLRPEFADKSNANQKKTQVKDTLIAKDPTVENKSYSLDTNEGSVVDNNYEVENSKPPVDQSLGDSVYSQNENTTSTTNLIVPNENTNSTAQTPPTTNNDSLINGPADSSNTNKSSTVEEQVY